jgi:hypothetical protein
MKKLWVGLVGCLCLMPMVALGAEATPPAAPEANWFYQHSDTILVMAGVLISIFGGVPFIKKVLASKLGIDAETFELVKAAAVETYHEYVKGIKDGKKDGKLTADEAKEARKRTTDKALAKAKELGMPLAAAVLPNLIEKAVNSLKRDGANASANKAAADKGRAEAGSAVDKFLAERPSAPAEE